MKQIDLNKLEDWYKKQLNKKYSKEHKFLSKRILTKAQEEISATKMAIKSWTSEEKYENAKNEGHPINEKMRTIIERFTEKVAEALNQIEIPGVDVEMGYGNSVKFCEQVRNLYQQYNVSGKKTLPRLKQLYNIEIKELDLHLRKIGDYSSKTANFLRKKYVGGKEAEALLRKIPNIEHNIGQLGTARKTFEDMQDKIEDLQKDLKNYNDSYEKLAETPELKKNQQINAEIRMKRRSLRSFIKYNKAFKKLRKGLEDGTLKVHDVNTEDLRKYVKAPVDELINEGEKTPNLRELLIRTRLILEDQNNPLKMKKELRDRIIENINEIVNEKALESKIKEIIDLKKEHDKYENILLEKGIQQKREELRDKIQTLTLDLEHFDNDLKHKQRDYEALLQKVAKYRDFLEERVLSEVDKKIKLNIIIPE